MIDEDRLDRLASTVAQAFSGTVGPDTVGSDTVGHAPTPTLPLHHSLSKSRSATPKDPCRWCDRVLQYDKLFALVDESLAPEIQLMTMNGWMRCMMSSRYFCYPFAPSCPRLMRTLLFSVVWNSHAMEIDTSCWIKATP